jgi:RNA-dependent RNA polymerase
MKYVSVGSAEAVPKDPISAMKDYYIRMIFNPSLGIVANLHMIHADLRGPCDPLCLELAELHSRAVDAAKTGDQVNIPDNLRVTQTPHHMTKCNDGQIYHSTSVLVSSANVPSYLYLEGRIV